MDIKNSLVLILFLVLASCGKGENTVINGTFSGHVQQTVYLEQISISNISIVDSAVTDDKGRFKFKLQMSDEYPVFYNLRVKEHNVPILLSAGERLSIKSLGNISRNYTVSGSEGTEYIKEFNEKGIRLREDIDSLNMVYYMNEYNIIESLTRRLVEYKQDIIKYVVERANSLVSIYALYQYYPTGGRIFDNISDILYYEMVYDSLNNYFPASPHVVSLKKDIENMHNRMEVANMLSTARTQLASFPEINLPDIQDRRIKLSSFLGKVVLLDFWISTHPESKLNNADLKEIYDRFSADGFEIYQVSLDDSKSEWLNNVHDQRINWISVRDRNGWASMSARLYNVNSLPANYLIDRDGNIIGKDISCEELAGKLKEIL
ncbi:MAG: AhpC/TSA family protein [Rikenellaceae bacterium]|nr:AhpC/TSA family protein [Rikenellaceae bacterium]